MPVPNPFSITYGTFEVGGETPYQLLGPYIIDKNYSQIRLVFDVIFAADSYVQLKLYSDNVESAFEKRLEFGEELTIDIDGDQWVYKEGETILRAIASVVKSGNADTDRAYSRAYTVTISGELPADAAIDDGLRDVEVNVQYHASRAKTVTFRGVYTPMGTTSAMQQYRSTFDAKASSYLTFVDSTAHWELNDETTQLDRYTDEGDPRPATVTFTRQYNQILFPQSLGVWNDTELKDHTVSFAQDLSYAGDTQENVYRLERVQASFDAALDIENTTDLQAVFQAKIKPFLVGNFVNTFPNRVYAVDSQRITYDETKKRIQVAMAFVYQPEGGDEYVEIHESMQYRETRQIDYTPTHSGGPLDYYADEGFAMLERVWTRVAVMIDDQASNSAMLASGQGSSGSQVASEIAGVKPPQQRMLTTSSGGGVGRGGGTVGSGGPGSNAGSGISAGWNVISSSSKGVPSYMGHPEYGQLRTFTVTDIITERYHNEPGGGGGSGFPGWRGGS